MKKKIMAFTLALSLAALSGCNGNESEVSGGGSSSQQTSPSFMTTAPETTESTETSEPEREIVTSAETREEVIALFLKAFAEKDEETLTAFGCGNYDNLFNKLCKALDNAGNLPENLDEIDLDLKLYEVYYEVNSAGSFERWEATYPLANGKFTFYIKYNDYDYVSKSYSIKSIEYKDHIPPLAGYRLLSRFFENLGSALQIRLRRSGAYTRTPPRRGSLRGIRYVEQQRHQPLYKARRTGYPADSKRQKRQAKYTVRL